MKLILIIFSFITFSKLIHADQYSCINPDLAKNTLSLLEDKKEVIFFCNICSDDAKIRVQIDTAYYKMGNICQQVFRQGVVFNGVKKGEKINKSIDLAYTWVNGNGVSKNIAKLLNLPVINLGEAFLWKNLKPYSLPKAKRKTRVIAAKLIDSLIFEFETFTTITTKNYNAEKVMVDSVSCKVDLSNHLIEFSQMYGSGYKTIYTIDLNQVSEIAIYNYDDLQKSLFIEGKLFVEFFKEQEVFSAMMYNRKYIQVNSEYAQLIVRQINQLIDFTKNYSF